MPEIKEVLQNNLEEFTKNFARTCKESSKVIALMVPIEIGLFIVAKGVLNALGIDLTHLNLPGAIPPTVEQANIALLSGVSLASNLIARGILDRRSKI